MLVTLAGLGAPNRAMGFDMNTLRYFLALFLVITLPPLFLYWLLIHPFVNFWRGKGIGPAFTIIVSVIIAGMIGLFSLRHFLLGIDYGSSYPLAALGVTLLIVAGALRFKLQKHLDIRTLLGFPEIAPERFPRRLVTEGIYARMRHPRYVAAPDRAHRLRADRQLLGGLSRRRALGASHLRHCRAGRKGIARSLRRHLR